MFTLIYLETYDACCWDDSGLKPCRKSHATLMRERAHVATAWYVSEVTGKEWGDDWDDSPACCNSGPPYEDRCVGLIKVDLILNMPDRAHV